MFYKMGARSYAELQKNKHHLAAAAAHFEQAITNATKKESKFTFVLHLAPGIGRIDLYI